MEPGRRVFCSPQCIETVDDEATRRRDHLATLQRDHDQQAAVIEAEIARFAHERRRVLAEQRSRIDFAASELAPLKANLAEAKRSGEVHFELASDRPVENGWR